jgi:hypothetical protein
MDTASILVEWIIKEEEGRDGGGTCSRAEMIELMT